MKKIPDSYERHCRMVKPIIDECPDASYKSMKKALEFCNETFNGGAEPKRAAVKYMLFEKSKDRIWDLTDMEEEEIEELPYAFRWACALKAVGRKKSFKEKKPRVNDNEFNILTEYIKKQPGIIAKNLLKVLLPRRSGIHLNQAIHKYLPGYARGYRGLLRAYLVKWSLECLNKQVNFHQIPRIL